MSNKNKNKSKTNDKNEHRTRITDTILRDSHQSLLATRMRTGTCLR